MTRSVALIIPCYNEAARLDAPEFLRLARSRPDLELVFVDDGSTDETAARLEELRAGEPSRVKVLRLAQNSGKAEAVRQGMQEALAEGVTIAGYADADLSTPVEGLLTLLASFEQRPGQVLMGSRVRMLGTRIERHAHRHYLGRLFATFASLALQIPVYDTQCGAKLFRAGPPLTAALRTPFQSRWIFDVELLARLLDGDVDAEPVPPSELRELPLDAWRDVAGSKLRPSTALHAGMEMIGLWLKRRYFQRRSPRSVAGAQPTA
jgi:glycosyltransferase involved in cell wall biosynthesis